MGAVIAFIRVTGASDALGCSEEWISSLNFERLCT